MQKKLQVIQQNEALHKLLPDYQLGGPNDVQILKAKGYYAYACDLRHLDRLDATLRNDFDMENCNVSILYFAEVSVAYMELEPANALLKWASSYSDGKTNCARQCHTILTTNQRASVSWNSIFQMVRTTRSRRQCSSISRNFVLLCMPLARWTK